MSADPLNGLPHPKGKIRETMQYFAQVQQELSRFNLNDAAAAAGLIYANLRHCHDHPHSTVEPLSNHSEAYTQAYKQLMESPHFDHAFFAIFKMNVRAMKNKPYVSEQHTESPAMDTSAVIIEHPGAGRQTSRKARAHRQHHVSSNQDAAAEVYNASKLVARAAVSAAASLSSSVFRYFRGSQAEDLHAHKTHRGSIK